MIRVALADDQTLVREGIKGLLALTSDLRVVAEASDGAEALRVLTTIPVYVALLDVRMPHVDGLEVQRILADCGARIPIVFLTGRASDEDERRARSAGAVAFLRKPVAQASLRQAIGDAIRASARGDRNDD